MCGLYWSENGWWQGKVNVQGQIKTDERQASPKRSVSYVFSHLHFSEHMGWTLFSDSWISEPSLFTWAGSSFNKENNWDILSRKRGTTKISCQKKEEEEGDVRLDLIFEARRRVTASMRSSVTFSPSANFSTVTLIFFVLLPPLSYHLAPPATYSQSSQPYLAGGCKG